MNKKQEKVKKQILDLEKEAINSINGIDDKSIVLKIIKMYEEPENNDNK